jgi:predicted permease
MRMVSLLRSIWKNLFQRDRAERDLDDELRVYVDLLADEYERAGMAPALARRAALVDSGGIEQVKDATRDAWAGNAFATAGRELRYAIRSLARAPAFFFIAVTTLTLGIGGTTAMYTIIKGSLLRPLPGVADPEQLVTVERFQNGSVIAELSYPDYLDLRQRSTTLVGLAGSNGTGMMLEGSEARRGTWVSFVTDNYFTVLGVRAAAGRLFRATDPDGRVDVIVLGYSLWQQQFSGSRTIIGSTVLIEAHPYTVIGVAEAGFIGAMAPYPMEAFIPIAMSGRVSSVLPGDIVHSRRQGRLRVVGRLADGRNADDAQRELAAIAAHLADTYPTNRNRSVRVWSGASMTAEELAEMSRVPALLSMGVALLLLIACGNVASLSLVRAASRRRELATRIALGATRAALLRQVAFEGIVIATAAGALGIIVAQLLVRSAALVHTVVPLSNPDLSMDLRVLAVALAAATLTAILVSALPSMQIVRLPPGAVLKDGTGVGRRRSTGQRFLVAAQVGASLVLLTAAAAVFGSIQRVLAAHDGFDPRGLSDVRFDFHLSARDRETASRTSTLPFYLEIAERAPSHPVIEGAAVASTIPPFQWSTRATLFRQGEEPPSSELAGREMELGLRVETIAVSPTFFDVMRIRLLRGRGFTASDRGGSEPVAIVSERVAQALWTTEDPIGKVIAWPRVEGPPRAPVRVVGVAADTRDLSLSDRPTLAMYVPAHQNPDYYNALIIRSQASMVVLEEAVRSLAAGIDPTVIVIEGRTLADRLKSEVTPQRTATAWIGVFGMVALLLACIGLSGVVAQSVLQRTRDLAIRSALGATPAGILVTILGGGMRLAAMGGIIGFVGVLAAHGMLRSMFATVQLAPEAIAWPAALLGVAVLAASYIPARRAAHLRPADVLRCD